MPSLVFTNDPHSWHTGTDFPNVPLTKVSWDTHPHHAVAFVFFGHVNIDFDGSPTAYGPAGITPQPDDDIGNAGNAHDGWFGVFALSPDDKMATLVPTKGKALIDNKASKFKGKFPVIQQAENGDLNPGYYVSTTSGPVSTGFAHLQNSYIDSSRFSYGALDGKLEKLGVNFGDFGLAIRHDQFLQSGFYFVDAGGAKFALGECSHKVGKNLGGTGRASHFNNNFPVSFIIFPSGINTRSSPWPRPRLSDDEIKCAIRPRLFELSRAGNSKELVMLMGLNEVPPKHRPRGKERLDALLRRPGSPKPYLEYAHIMAGLYTFGFDPYLPSPKKAMIF